MGRPAASPVNKSIALEFAKMITRKTDNANDLVARCGQCSIFSALREICPSLSREGNTENRDGLTEVEFNKMLQVQTVAPT